MKMRKLIKEIQKPPVEVMAMKQKQLEVYFPALIDTLYQKEGVKRGNKWAVKNKDGVLTAPDPTCPNWHDGIVDSSKFVGVNRVYPGGNITFRLKMLIYWLFLKNGIDPETYCEKADPKTGREIGQLAISRTLVRMK